MEGLSGIAQILGLGTAGAGLFGNVMNSITRGKEVGNLQSAEKKFTSLTPEQLSGMVTKAEQPLGQDLLQNVGNLVQADVAGRGLAESPGVFAATETQAVAPYQLQQQQMALQLIMKQLGLPIEYATAILSSMGGNANVSPLLQMLMQQNGTSGGVPPSVPGGDNTAAILQQIIASQGPANPGLTPTFPGSGGSSDAGSGGMGL
jgi:hypothetical protein